jgi:serine/threonine protein kinase
VQNLEALGYGVSGMVWAIDKTRVAKVHLGSLRSIQDAKTERRAYRKLSQPGRQPHPNVLWCFNTENPKGLVLERCQESVRQRLQSMPKGSAVPSEDVIRWAYQAASGLAYIHKCRIIHGDGTLHIL